MYLNTICVNLRVSAGGRPVASVIAFEITKLAILAEAGIQESQGWTPSGGEGRLGTGLTTFSELRALDSRFRGNDGSLNQSARLILSNVVARPGYATLLRNIVRR